MGNSASIDRWLKTSILVFLWVALVEDILIFVLSWVYPDLWFKAFHGAQAEGLDASWLRRTGGQWAAFALGQGLALWRWRKEAIWLVLVAGLRSSDLFTDLSYLLSVPSLTTLGWALLLPPIVLNPIGVFIMLRGYQQLMRPTPANNKTSGLDS